MERPRAKRIAANILAVLVLVLALFYFFAPRIVDRVANRVTNAPPYSVDPAAQALHDTLFVVDLHGDPLLWGRNLLKRNNHGAIDVPRLIEGNVGIQSFFIVTKAPFGMNIDRTEANSDMITWLAVLQGWPFRTWGNLTERAVYQAELLQGFAEHADGKLIPIASRFDLKNYRKLKSQDKNVVGAVVGVEGAHALEGDVNNVGRLFDYGVRIIAPTHFFDTDLGGSMHGVDKGGLTEFGRKVIREMEEYSIILDLAHASADLIDGALAISTRPVIVSHTGVKGTCDNNRNLTDAQVTAIAKTGGVIGIGYWPTAVCGDDAKAIVKAIRYTADLVGVDHVALGSDYDGAVPVPFDTTGLAQIVEALIADGFEEAEIRKIMGENAARVFALALP